MRKGATVSLLSRPLPRPPAASSAPQHLASEAAQAQRGPRRRLRQRPREHVPARPCPALSWALRPRSRRFHAPERGCVWVALKEEQAAGESALKGLLRRIPACAPWARAPERGGHRAGSYSEVGSSEGLPGWGARAGGEWRGVAFPA